MALQDQLTQTAQSLGRIETEPGREGGDDRYYTSTGVYAEKVGPDRYRVPVLGNVDADGTPGRGAFMAEVDGSGKVVRQPYYQQPTNNDWTGLAAFVLTAAGGMMASAFNPAAAIGAEDLAGIGLGGGVTTGEAALGSYTLPATSAAAISQATGIPVSALTGVGALAKLAPSVLNSIKSFLPSGVQNAIGMLTGSGDLSNIANLIGSAAAANELIGASNTAANDYNALGNDQANEFYSLFGNIDNRTQGIGNDLNARYQNLGVDNARMLGDLATQAKGDYTALGTAAAGTYNGIAGNTKTAYDNLLTNIKGTTEKFTPWNITTNVGSTNKGVFTPTAGTQNVSDQATAAAGSSFGAANGIDVANLAQQKFGQQKATLAPYDAQELAALRANLAATGRTGVASNATGTGISPQLAAYYLSKGTRDQQLLTNADQAALAVRGGLVNQGVASAGVPNQIAGTGLQQVQAGVNAGATQASTNNQLGQMLGSLGARGIDATTQAQTHGADSTLPLFASAVSVPLGLQKQGIDNMLSQGNQGLGALTRQLDLGTNAAQTLGTNAINARYSNFAKAIDQRYRGRFDKATLLARMAQQLGAMSNPTVQRAASSGDVGALTQALLDLGVSQNTIRDVLASDATSAAHDINSIFGAGEALY